MITYICIYIGHIWICYSIKQYLFEDNGSFTLDISFSENSLYNEAQNINFLKNIFRDYQTLMKNNFLLSI